MARIWVAMVTTAALATSAAAHMPYVLPSAFDAGTRSVIGIEASFGEDAFRAEVAMQDAPFEITAPDGSSTKLAAPVRVRDTTLAEAALPADGIYRVSSGQRLGRMGKMYRDGTAWKMVGEDGAPPAGATLVDVRSTTLADAYVLRGKPGTTAALKPRGTALEIQPLADPTAYAPGTPIRVAILFHGKPLAGQSVTLFREAGFYDGRKQAGEMLSNEKGEVSLTPPDAGRYLLMTRYRPAAAGPEGHLSYTTTLAIEAM